MGAAISGLDASQVESVLRMQGHGRRARARIFEQLQVMEAAALAAIYE